MEKISGIKLESFPIHGMRKVADILEYDGPILSHFVDEFENSYLYYWVDYDEAFNRWLIWKSTNNQILAYLSGESSLRDLVLSDNKDYIYIVDIDENLVYHNSHLVSRYLLPSKYLPEVNSFYLLEPDELYLNTLSSGKQSTANEDMYVDILLKQTVYFKMEPKAARFGTTVSFKDAAEFFKNVSSSFIEYYKYYFYHDFKNKYITQKALNQAVSSFIEFINPRISYTKLGSLEIGLGIDSLHATEKKFKEWQFEKLQEYKNDVIDLDLNQEDNLILIEEKYPIEVRNKVFKPIIDIRNSKSFTVKTSDTPTSYRRKLTSVNERSKNRLISKWENNDELPKEEKEFVVVYLELPKNRSVKELKKQEITSGMLFSELTDHISIPVKEISSNNLIIRLQKPLYIDVINKEGAYELTVKDTEIVVKADSREAGLNTIIANLINLFKKLGYDEFSKLFTIDSIDYPQT